MTDEEFEAWMAAEDAAHDARQAAIQSLVDSGPRPFSARHTDGTEEIMVTRDMGPRSAEWRITFVDDEGPRGHREYDTWEKLVRDSYREIDTSTIKWHGKKKANPSRWRSEAHKARAADWQLYKDDMAWIRREERIVRDARDGKLAKDRAICAEDRKALKRSCADRRELSRDDAREMLRNLKEQKRRARARWEARRALALDERAGSPLLQNMGESDDSVAYNLESEEHGPEKVAAWWRGIRFLIPYDKPNRHELAVEYFHDNAHNWRADWTPGYYDESEGFDPQFDVPREELEALPF